MLSGQPRAASWRQHHVRTNGIRLQVTEQGEGYPVLLCHGFPELAYSWRHQIPALAHAGLRAIAPDLRGYGGSDKPGEISDYRIELLVDDLVGLLDELNLENAVLVGHDWGSIVVWTTALRHPARVERVVSLNVPYQGHPAGFPSISFIRERLPERFGYVLFFQEPGRAEHWFAEDPRAKLLTFYQGATHNTGFLSDDEYEVFLSAFEAGGISGPVNYYRNIDHNIEATADLVKRQVRCPTLMIFADRDPVLPARLGEGMERHVPDLRIEVIEDCGHWTQQERPDDVNRLLLDFLGDLAR
jgi:soluble epoxide hydrolase / lipid-phosphate phosphatase